MGDTFELNMDSGGCCDELGCEPLSTNFLCPICKRAWKEHGISEAYEMVGQPPGVFLAHHRSAGSDPRFTCSECGQLFVLRAAERLPTEAGQDHRCLIEAIETEIPLNATFYLNGDREHWIGLSVTSDVTGTVLVVRKYTYQGENRLNRRMESLTVLYPWKLDSILSVANALDRARFQGNSDEP